MTFDEERAYERLVNEYEILRKAILENNVKITKRIIADLNIDKESVVNFAPREDNSLLFIACQIGYIEQVECLIDAGAKCNPHKTTKCTPLYAAIRGGHVAIVRTLLQHFPDSINCVTSENWSPLHVACINGKNEIVDLFLMHPYAKDQLRKFRFGEWEYSFAFDPNQLDSFNQTPLYIACLSGNDYIIERLLNWRLVCCRPSQPEHEILLCPIDMNVQCAVVKETALMAAVRGDFAYIVSVLLRNGSNPNVYNSNLSDNLDSEENTGNSVLIEAARQKSFLLTELLLRFGAKDFDSGAMKIACGNAMEDLVQCLLARQSHRDPEYKLNETDLLIGGNLGQRLPSFCNTYSHIFPTYPTVINWNFGNCQLNEIKTKWILAAIQNCNPKLKTSSTINQISLGAVTRIDISHNSLTILPNEIFSMCSLRYLNAAKNKIEHLPSPEHCSYNSPVLEEIYLQDNSLEEILPEIFRLPSLITLDISNNKLQKIPFDMWRAPKLRELNIAFNLLKDLPTSEESNASAIFKYKSTEITSMTRNVRNDLIHQNIWSKSLEIVDRDATQFSELRGSSALRNLNLSNNLFTSIPPALPCLAENLSRLNMSYNSLRSMGHVTSYPAFLRQLDLSHNEISCWPSLVTVNSADPYLACYDSESEHSGKFNAAHTTILESSQTDVYLNLCCHKKHLRLESLKTLILADNLLTKIQLSTDDITTFSETEDTEWTNIGITKLRLMYPNLSMLDISNNCLKEVPQFLHKLTNLSILNISGNIDIAELPANMGLLCRLWNLNTKGCSLQGYLSTMIESKKFKTMEIIGYLKSIYEDARPYARMKLMVVGSQGIGKTSILELLREMYPNQNKKILSGDHWTKRMGATVATNSKKKNYNISTVGVDIGDLVCEEKRKNGASLYGPVVFRTWDFGGQKEYYATHQYFLSKRSLYLVVWRIDDGKNGLVEVLQWLGNIQARAPNSPVIIVGTHHDNIGSNITEADAASLQQYIRERFIAVTDSEKIGLPKVMSSIELSCKTQYNVRELGSLIYDTVYSLKTPGSKELLLHQNVPASYLALEDVVANISAYLRQVGSDPVLNYENFKQMVYQEMHYQNFKSFRDTSELQQAVMFLHENGVLLHYNDTTLRDFYFLDPQWLCDMLAQVVTIKEINPFVKNGVMKIDDINHLIKTSTGQAGTDRKYILNLLNKFEVALTWDLRTLLIPSLLPITENEPENTITLKLPSKSPKRQMSISESSTHLKNDYQASAYQFKPTFKQLSRLLLISYFPSGFWSRLMIRVLADTQIGEIAQNIYNSTEDLQNNKIHWKLWQTGLELYYADRLIFKLREVSQCCLQSPYRQGQNKFRIKQDGIWADVDLTRSSVLEIFFPLGDLGNEREQNGKDSSNHKSTGVNIQHVTKLLSACVDHVDILLEDWYPTIGTRFVHTSEGRFLVTRLVPCPLCIARTQSKQDANGLTNTTNGHESHPNENETSQLNGNSTNGYDKSHLQTTVWNYLWTIEECVLSTYDKKVLVCPIHGDVSVVQIAPDLVFLDLNPDNVIKANEIVKGNLIGRGAFGFVFKATMQKLSDEEPKSVALKMLQPVQPGIRTGKSALLAYKAALEKWRRDPLQHSCKAYFTARQELTVMLNLKHSNIMSLIGICMQPLALILDCAPLGALDVIIQNYRRGGSRIGAYCFQRIVLQTSRAIEYLHRSHIIYRDLKAENVLVWKFPEPMQMDAPENPVHIKLADYGISRIALPTGTKGFGGTEGFMAPEIIRHNGEEEYTEKVDCFSFGMFLYELITLRQPFEGHETVKESILEGSRPVFTSREVMFPSYCLDLMVLCWDHQPKNRPSASQIVSIACAPEFTHLIDVILLPHSDNVIAMCTLNNQKTPRDASFKLWISIERCIEIITGQSQGWLNYQRFQPSQMLPSIKCETASIRMTAMCSVKMNTVWFGDSRGFIHSFDESDNSCAFSYELDSAAVIKIECVLNTNYVVAGLANGRIFILDSTCYPIKCVNAKDDFVLTDACVNSKLFSLTAYCNSSRTFAVWCGRNHGQITIFEFKTDTFESRQFNLQHINNTSPDISVTILATSQNSIYSYPSPGCVLYQWSTLSKKILNQLDCLRLVPCSESLGSISIDKNLSVGRCQITAVCVLNQNIYVGTSWGCLIVAENATLTPITVFRPYEEEVQYISVIPSDNASNVSAVILSVGRGYRSLINRYTDVDKSNQTKEKKNHQTHCILWRAEHWTPI